MCSKVGALAFTMEDSGTKMGGEIPSFLVSSTPNSTQEFDFQRRQVDGTLPAQLFESVDEMRSCQVFVVDMATLKCPPALPNG